jgi:hypothetical protein
MPTIDLGEEEWRYLTLLVKNKHNDMVTAAELADVIETSYTNEVCAAELFITERLLKALDPEDKAVFTKDYPYLRDP